jgi:methyl-accepting chemotaxis protein
MAKNVTRDTERLQMMQSNNKELSSAVSRIQSNNKELQKSTSIVAPESRGYRNNRSSNNRIGAGIDRIGAGVEKQGAELSSIANAISDIASEAQSAATTHDHPTETGKQVPNKTVT